MVRVGLIAIFLYLCWLGMMAVHESGHVLHAWLSGGKVTSVQFGLWEFSRTNLSNNPHPQFVAWGGPIWGSIIPSIFYALALKGPRILKHHMGFFCGFCLIANGSYIGLGWPMKVGDAGDLLRHGASAWTLSLFGLVTVVSGLMVWHRLGPRFGLGKVAAPSAVKPQA
jgi:hypothetical protein